MSSSATFSEFLKPLVNLGMTIDNKLNKIRKNDYSESSIDESWQIAHQLDENSRLMKKESKQLLANLKENVTTLDSFHDSHVELMHKSRDFLTEMRKMMQENYGYESIPITVKKIERKQAKEPIVKQAVSQQQENVQPEEEFIKQEQSQNEVVKLQQEKKYEPPTTPSIVLNDSDGYSSSPEVPKFLEQLRKNGQTRLSGDSPERPDEFFKKEKPTNAIVNSVKKPLRVRTTQTPQRVEFSSLNDQDDDDPDDFYLKSCLHACKDYSENNWRNYDEDNTITQFKPRKPSFKTPQRPNSQLFKLTSETGRESQVTPILEPTICSIREDAANCIKTPTSQRFNINQDTMKSKFLYDDIDTPTTPPGLDIHQQNDGNGSSFRTIDPVSRREYDGLKSYELGHLRLDEINEAISTINSLIIKKEIHPLSLQSLDIRKACNLDTKTSQFIISLLKLDRLSETSQYNVYQVKQ